MFKENTRDGVDSNFNDSDYCVPKNEGTIPWFSADCIVCLLTREKAQLRRPSSVAFIQTEIDKKVSVSAECCKTLAF